MQRVAGRDKVRRRSTLAHVAAVATASLAGGVLMAVWRGALPDAATAAPPLLYSVSLFAALWAFAIITWRRLAAIGRATDNAVVYDHGVRRFGLGMGGTIAVWTALRPRWPVHIASGADHLLDLAFLLALSFLISIPTAMWAGYVWGRIMGAVFHVPKPPGGRRPDV